MPLLVAERLPIIFVVLSSHIKVVWAECDFANKKQCSPHRHASASSSL